MAQVNLALLGFGRAGKLHYGNITSDSRFSLRYVVEHADVVASVEEQLKRDNQTATVLGTEDLDTALQDKSVGGVVIATPTPFHQDQIVRSLKAGKAVFVEKPVASTPDEAIQVYKLAKELNLPLHCSFQRRFDPSLRSIYEHVREGGAGNLHVIKSTSRDHPPVEDEGYIKSSGGFFTDSAVHDLDIVCWLAGEFPCSVYSQAHAHKQVFKDYEDVDTLAITLKFPSGAMGIIDMSRTAAYGYDQRVEVLGLKGMSVSENQYPTGVVHADEAGVSRGKIKPSFQTRYKEAYMNSLDHFVKVMQGECKQEVLGHEVVNVSRLAYACQKSYKEQTLVTFEPTTAADI